MAPQSVAGWPSSQRGLLQSQSLLGVVKEAPDGGDRAGESLFISECQHLGLARLLERSVPGETPQPTLQEENRSLGCGRVLAPRELGEGVDGHGLLRGAEGALKGTQGIEALPSVSLRLFACAHWGSHMFLVRHSDRQTPED